MKQFKVTELVNDRRFHAVVILGGIFLDQLTKFWAVSRFTNEQGLPTYQRIRVLGDYLRFSLAYNEGAAFSSRPQDILPFLSPPVFYLVLTLVALGVLFWFYTSIDKRDWLSRLGIVMVISGAIGNFWDRMRLQKVIDFIDCDFPDFIMTRFPTFNVADSFVTVGVALLLLSPLILRGIHKQIKTEAKAAEATKAEQKAAQKARQAAQAKAKDDAED